MEGWQAGRWLRTPTPAWHVRQPSKAKAYTRAVHVRLHHRPPCVFCGLPPRQGPVPPI